MPCPKAGRWKSSLTLAVSDHLSPAPDEGPAPCTSPGGSFHGVVVPETGQSASIDELRHGFSPLTLFGDVERALGDRESALGAYRRGLEISERLVAEYGETPEALRDVSVSLDASAMSSVALGDRESALGAYRRGLEISERLVAEYGETPEALRDLMISHIKTWLVSEKDEAVDRLRRARALTEDIIARGWGVPQNQEDREWIDATLRRLEDEAEG